MAQKTIGISPELLIHPGETLMDEINARGMSQAELAVRTGVSTAYVCNVIAGKKDISVRFAHALEYALGISKSFWMNLQMEYDLEKAELDEKQSIMSSEATLADTVADTFDIMPEVLIPDSEKKISSSSVFSLRRYLRISDLHDLSRLVPDHMYAPAVTARGEDTEKVRYRLGVWICLCRNHIRGPEVETVFDAKRIPEMAAEVNSIAGNHSKEIVQDMQLVLKEYGISYATDPYSNIYEAYSYIEKQRGGSYKVIAPGGMSENDLFKGLFRAVGHIQGGSLKKNSYYVDCCSGNPRKAAAESFVKDMLLEIGDSQVLLESNQ